jgi:uncharacterized membrane protein
MKSILKNINAQYLFLGLVVVDIVCTVFGLAQLPEAIAIHWDMNGNVNGWESKGNYLTQHFLIIVFIVSLRWVLISVAQWQNGINIFQYHIWSQAGKEAFVRFMERHSWLIASLLLGAFLAVDILVFRANSIAQTEINSIIEPALIVLVLAGLVWWSVALLVEIQRIKKLEYKISTPNENNT